METDACQRWGGWWKPPKIVSCCFLIDTLHSTNRRACVFITAHHSRQLNLIEKKIYIYISVQQQNYLFQDILEGLKTFVGFYCHVLVVVIWPSLSWEISQTETLRGIHKCQRRSLEFQGASTWEISMQATDPGTCCRRVLKSGTCTVCRGALELHSSHFVSAGEELDGESQTLVPHQVQSPLPI